MIIETQADYRTAVTERNVLLAQLDRLTEFAVGLEQSGAIDHDCESLISDLRSNLRGRADELANDIADFCGSDDADDRAWANSRLGVTTGRAA